MLSGLGGDLFAQHAQLVIAVARIDGVANLAVPIARWARALAVAVLDGARSAWTQEAESAARRRSASAD